MMACSALLCHKKAKNQRKEQLAALQLQTDTDKADAEIAALTESKDFPLPASTQLMHKRAMPEGLQTGIDDSLPGSKNSNKSKNMERPKSHRKLHFQPTLSTGADNMSNITSDQVDTSPLSVQDSMLCSVGLHVENPALAHTIEKQRSNAATSASSRKRKLSSEEKLS
jgi:hypothetical protein